jgi:hypothetical protein
VISRRSLFALPAALAANGQPTILLRSGWQTINIGDIAHTPGVLTILKREVPEAKVTLWSGAVDLGVREMLLRHFPNLPIVSGEPNTPSIQAAFRESQFLLHGSGASLVARGHVDTWLAQTRKPYGAFGITIQKQQEAVGSAMTPELRETLNAASFLYTRETRSLENLRDEKISGPAIGFAPDGTFGLDIRDDQRAAQFLSTVGLAEDGFLCVIPRLRYTPYHKIRKVDWTPEEIARREGVNRQWETEDAAKLREAIVAWVRQTKRRVLLCPEMTYQLEMLRPLLFNPLPADVKPSVRIRDTYWLTDEAASVYRRAAAVLSCECHSPILSASQGTPCAYVHQPEDGIKGQMWMDVGLGDWYFPIEKTAGADLAKWALAIAADPAGAKQKARAAVDRASVLHRGAAQTLRRCLGLS